MTITYDEMATCVIAYLSFIKGLICSIDRIETNLARCCATLDLMGVDYSAKSYVDTSSPLNGDDKVLNGISKLHSLREELAGEVASSVDAIRHARNLCPPGDLDRYVLWLHYAEGETWAEVAKNLGYCVDNVRGKMRTRGVVKLYRSLPKEWKK